MKKYTLNVNRKKYEFEATPDTPLLWILRDTLHLYGTKYGCGIAQCGACTIHLDGMVVRSCVLPIETVGDRKITTIEGLSKNNDHPVQQAWEEVDVPQCGYCQSGQIMSAVGLLAQNPNPSEEDINLAMKGNICRCGTYPRIKKAIKLAAEKSKS